MGLTSSSLASPREKRTRSYRRDVDVGERLFVDYLRQKARCPRGYDYVANGALSPACVAYKPVSKPVVKPVVKPVSKPAGECGGGRVRCGAPRVEEVRLRPLAVPRSLSPEEYRVEREDRAGYPRSYAASLADQAQENGRVRAADRLRRLAMCQRGWTPAGPGRCARGGRETPALRAPRPLSVENLSDVPPPVKPPFDSRAAARWHTFSYS